MRRFRIPSRGAFAASVAVSVALAAVATGATPPSATISPLYLGQGGADDAPRAAQVTPGHDTVLPLGVVYAGPAPANGPITATVSLPVEATYIRSYATLPGADSSGARWDCRTDGPTATCTLTDVRTGTAFALPPSQSAHLTLVIRGGSAPAPAPGSQQPIGSARATLAVPTAQGTLTDEAAIPLNYVAGPQPPRIVVNQESDPSTDSGAAGGARSYRLIARNVGGTPTSRRGGAPAIELRGVLPSRNLRGLRASGPGWQCTAAAQGTCTYRAALVPGADAPPITVRWRSGIDASAIDLQWRISGIARYAGQAFANLPGQENTAPGERPAPGTVPVESRLGLREAATAARLMVRATAPAGISVMPGRSPRAVRARIANVGRSTAPVTGVRVTVPTGVRATVRDPGWQCSARGASTTCLRPGAVAPGGVVALDIAVDAAASRQAGRGRLVIHPVGRAGVRRGDPVVIPLVIEDPGDPQATPQVWFRERGTWTPWVRGGPIRVPAYDPFTYQVRMVNRGGDALPAGAVVRVRQPIARGMRIESVTSPTGMACSRSRGISCTVTAPAPVPPGGVVGIAQVTVRPTAPATEAGLGVVTATIAGQAGAERTPVRVTVVDNPQSLRPSQRVQLMPTAGGRGRLVLVVRNEGTVPVTGMALRGDLPPGINVRSATGPGWTCRGSGRRVSCTFAPTVRGQARTAGLTVRVAATGDRASRDRATWHAHAVRTDTGRRQAGTRRGPLPVRGPIAARAEANPVVLTASKRARARSREAALDGTASTGNGISLDYEWRQRCTTTADAAAFRPCRGTVAPRAVIRQPNVASTKAEIPRVPRRTLFVFELAITDGSATRTQVVTVTAMAPARVPRTTGRSTPGAAPDAAARRAAAVRAATERARVRNQARANTVAGRRAAARTDARAARQQVRARPTVAVTGAPLITANAGDEVSLSAVPGGRWDGDVKYSWTQTGGPSAVPSGAESATATIRAPAETALLTYLVTATGPRGESATAQVAVSTQLQGPQAFQSLANRAAQGSGFRQSFPGGITIAFRSVTPGGGPPGSFAFSGASVSIGALRIARVTGTVSPQGITLASGTLTLPSSWRLAPVSIASGQPLVLAFRDQGVAVTGQVVAQDAFGILPLPAGWSGSTTLTFSDTTYAVDAVARGDGSGRVQLTGTFASSGDYSARVTADQLVSVGDARIDMVGTVQSTGGTVTASITGSLATPVALADGISLTTLTTTWAPTAPRGQPVVTGQATVSIASGSSAPLQLNAALAYRSRSTWTMQVTASGGPTWTPVPGLQISPSDFSGSIGQNNAAWAWQLNAAIPTWNVSRVLTLRNLGITLSDTCSGTNPPCPDASMFLRIQTAAQLTPPVGQGFTVDSVAVIGLGGAGGFALSASVPDLRVAPGITVGQPSFTVTYDMPEGSIPARIGAPSFSAQTENGFAMVVGGRLSVPGLGSFAQIAANITSQGWSIGGFDPDGVSLGLGNGLQTNAFFGWSSFATTMTADVPGFGIQQVPITPGSFAVTGGFTAPQWFAKLTGVSPPTALGTVQFNPANGFFTAMIDLPGGFSLPGGGSSVDLSGLAFEIQNDGAGLTMSVVATARLGVKEMSGGTQAAPELEMAMSYDVQTTNVEASLTFIDPSGWKNAFGVPGLVITEASFTFMWNLATETPGFKMMASGDLPPGLAGPFKVPGQDIPILIGAELSDTNPCVDVQVGSTTGTQPVLQMDGGAITANFFEFIIAPSGCQLAPNVPAIPPGYQLAFDGAVLGTTVDVTAAMGLDPTTYRGTVKIGAFDLAGLQFDDTTISVDLDEQRGINDVSFSGGFTIFGTAINVAGSLDQDGQNTTASLTASEAGTLSVDGFRLTDMRFTAQVTHGPQVDDIAVSASGKIDILGVDTDVDRFAVTIDNGVVDDVDFDISTSINIAETATATGRFAMNYAESSGNLDLTASVVLTTPEGFSIGTTAQPATLDISPQCVGFTGALQMDGLFTADLAGTMVYKAGCAEPVTNAQGARVPGAPGDYSFSASDVGIAVGPFQAAGQVALGSVGGSAYAQMGATLDLSPQASQDEVTVTGTFASSGDFSMTGSGVLALAGFSLDTRVTAAKQGPAVSVTGATTLSLGVTDVALAGAFTEQGGIPSTTLTGSVNSLVLGGFNLGAASITLAQTPQQMGVTAAVNAAFGASDARVTADGQVSIVAPLGGGAPLFHGSLEGGLGIPALSGLDANLTATFTDCTANCTQATTPSLTLSGQLREAGFSFAVTADVSPSGQFGATASTGGSACTGTVELVGVEFDACFGYSIRLFVGSSAPYGSIDTSASASVRERHWNAKPWYKPWKWGWSGWSSYGTDIGAEVRLDPFRVCARVIGHDLCT